MKIDFLSYQPDQVATVKGVVFGILSPDRIRAMSSCEIYRHITGNQKSQPGTQSDSRLGVIDRGRVCKTCLQDYNDCPGHMGHINLAKPVFHPLYLGTSGILKKLLTMICFNCSRLLINFETEGIEQKVRSIRSKIPKARFNMVKAIVDDQRKKNALCPHCGATTHSKIKQHPSFFSKIQVIYEKKEAGAKKASVYERTINPEITLAFLKGMTDEDISLAGFDPELSRPEWMIWTVVPFPPITMRPPTKLDIGRDADDDLTIKLNDISKTNNNIKIQLQKIVESGEGKSSYGEIDFLWEILQFHVTTYIDNESTKKTSVHRSGRPLKALVQRIKTKEGRIRWNLMGKRVDDSGRTVATPDNNINVDEIGVPKKIATNLVKPEFVTPFNIDRLQQYVHNGMDHYPGAKYVVPHGTRFKKHLKIMDKERRLQIKLQYGDVVFRNLLDGDWVLVNRQPSLHRMSMMAHKIVILKGETFRLNVQAVTPYNADFDGDEINLHVPQSLEAENEMARLAHLATQIVSPKNAVPVMGLVQDGLLGLHLFNKYGHLSVKNAMKMASDLKLKSALRYQQTGGEHVGLVLEAREILNATLPKISVVNSKDIEKDSVQYGMIKRGETINTGTLKAGKSGLFHITWNDYGPEVARRLFDDLARIATNWLLISGFSVGILDCIPNAYIKDRIYNVIQTYDMATQYLVDFQQLRNTPDLATDLISGTKGAEFQLNTLEPLLATIKKEGYTYNNKQEVERLLAEVYYHFLVNRLIFEILRLYRFQNSFPEGHVQRQFNENATHVLKFYLHSKEGFQERISRLEDSASPETRAAFEQLKTLEILKSGTDYFAKSTEILQSLRGLSQVNLIGVDLGDDGSGISPGSIDTLDERLISQLEGFGAFAMTLLYIVPGAKDMSDRLEEKLYELMQGSSSIVNTIVSTNVGFYQYRGLDQDHFKYLGNGFQTMATAKSKGDSTNIGQIAGLLGQQDLEGKRQGNFFYRRSLPHYPKDSIEPKYRGYVQNSFLEGLTMLEYFSHAQAGRINQIDKSIKTAETGYLQRRLIKMLEPLYNGYDGAIRNSSHNVIQKLYGGDAINPQHLEKIKIELGQIDERYEFTMDDLDELASRVDSGTPEGQALLERLQSGDRGDYLRAVNQQRDYVEGLTNQLVKLYQGQDIDFGDLETERKAIWSPLPVNFERLVHNNFYRFKLKENQTTDLDPVYLYGKLRELSNRIMDGMVLNGNQHCLLFNLAFHQYLNAKSLLFDYHFTREAFTVLLEDIYLKYCRSLIAPGDAIGIISAQSIGEPLTQMTLNKFHAAGVGKARSKLQGGVPRLSELLGLTKKEKMKTPSMSLEVSEYYLETQKVINPNLNIDLGLVNTMKSFNFVNLVSTSEICYDPRLSKPGLGEDASTWSIIKEGTRLTRETPWLIHFTLKPEVKRELRSDSLKNLLETYINSKYKSSEGHYHVLVSYDGLTHEGKLASFVQIRVRSDLFTGSENILGSLVTLKRELLKLNIKGQKDVNEVFVEREAGKKYIFTIGSNLRSIIENPVYRSIVDLSKITSNDILEIEELYGIEAARYAFINEMHTTFDSDINIRHLELLADNMAHLGELLRVNRFGVKRGNNEPLHRASFEETTKQFVDSSMFTEKDPMTGPSANIMFGQLINSGTNSFRIMLDVEKLQTLSTDKTTQSQREFVQIDPFNRKAVEEINVPNTSQPLIQQLNIADLFVFNFSYVPDN